MAYQESSYKNLVFGVSQQAAQDRLPGQLQAQINMTSDLVAGLRRRASVEAVTAVGTFTDVKSVRQYNTDIGGTAVSLICDAVNGTVKVVEEATGVALADFQNNYLKAAVARSLRLVTLNDAVWLCNVEQKAVVTPAADRATYPNPNHWGYYYVAAGAFQKAYTLTLTDRSVDPPTSNTVTYTTPVSTVAEATPEFIASKLAELARAAWTAYGVTITVEGTFASIQCATSKPTISTTSGSAYMRCSNAMSIRDAAELPARLPLVMNNIIVATGASNTKVYYRYNDAEKRWIEDANWEDLKDLSNMPLRMTQDETTNVYKLEAPVYERRAAGDEKSNPLLKFITQGITGMAAFQGRLVFLSNEYACLSASDNPLRFFRSTLSTVADNDPIEVAAQGSLTAPYEYAVNFNKDLVMFSRHYQGIIPGSQLVTPRTANVALMTRYEVDTSAEPTAAGRSIFFGAPRSLGYVGVHEMTPSQYADSQYVADDVTSHIPRYIQGPWRFMVSSTTSNIMVAGTADHNELVIHEYLWNQSEKAHQSWHKWKFAWPVIDAYFSGDVLICLFGVEGSLYLCRIDLQRGAGDISPTVPRLDFFTEATCTVPGKLTVPNYVLDMGTDLRAFKVEGENAYLGQKVFSNVRGTTTTELDIPEALVGERYAVGYQYESLFTLTPPVLKDAKDVPITTSRGVLHKYRVSVANTGLFTYVVSDAARAGVPQTTTPMRLFSQRLGAGLPLADTSTVTVPGRVDLATASLTLSSSDYYDLNVRSIEYGFRFHQQFRRM